MILAHIGGVPFEEWVGPVLAGGSAVSLAVHAAFLRIRRRS